jgi:hypothetical protein
MPDPTDVDLSAKEVFELASPDAITAFHHSFWHLLTCDWTLAAGRIDVLYGQIASTFVPAPNDRSPCPSGEMPSVGRWPRFDSWQGGS